MNPTHAPMPELPESCPDCAEEPPCVACQVLGDRAPRKPPTETNPPKNPETT